MDAGRDYHDFDGGNVPEFTVRFRLREEHELHELLGDDEASVTFKVEGERYTLLQSSIRSVPIDRLRQFVQAKYGFSGGNDSQIFEEAERRGGIIQAFRTPGVLYIGEYRSLNDDAELKQRLHGLINYNWQSQRINRPLKLALEKFVTEVVGKKTEISIPTIDDEIELIFDEGDRIPISSLGTGLHQIITLAFHVVTNYNKIICIDEPELHLHPAIQYKLFELINATPSQFFIATHSNCFLDHRIVEKQIYHVRKAENGSEVTLCSDIRQYADVLDELGIRASELLQTNGIIWVEGPSDRTYINRWLELKGCKYKEGYDFTYQYYGGTLLAHYGVGNSDDDFNRLVDLLMVNKNGYIVMDSDMTCVYQESQLAPRKRKIIEQANAKGVKYWVTMGREIENYLPNRLLTSFAAAPIVRTKFGHIERYCSKYTDKVLHSQKICESMLAEDLAGNFNLDEKLEELLARIESWNNLSTAD
jgi:hypothetical protein